MMPRDFQIRGVSIVVSRDPKPSAHSPAFATSQNSIITILPDQKLGSP